MSRPTDSPVPLDLLLICLWSIGVLALVYATGSAIGTLTPLLALPLVFLFPGYALVVALFPESTAISPIERAVLSVTISLFTIPLVGFVANYTTWGVRAESYLVGLSAVALVGASLAVLRLYRTSHDSRHTFPVASGMDTVRNIVFPRSRRVAVLNTLVAISIVAATVSVGYAFVTPAPDSGFTESYVLGEDESGDYVADEYPTEMALNEAESLAFGIENHEQSTVDYTIVVELQRVESSNGEFEVQERQEIDRFDETLEAGEASVIEHQITPELQGDDLRLVYLVYHDEPPSTPTTQNAYQENHLWVSVSESAATVGTCPGTCG